jgi:membrane associated rhomboid family serine protease
MGHDARVVIPIHDKNPVRRPSVVTWGLIAANSAIFLASPIAFAGPNPRAGTKAQETAYLYHYGAIPKVILSTHGNPLWPAFTAVFVHAGWIHLLGNMLFLFIFGNNVEDAFGRVHFLAFYLLGGAASTYAFALSAPDSIDPLVGASGAIAAVLGAYVYLFPQARITLLLPFLWFLPLRVPAWLMLGFWFVMQLPEFQQTIGVTSSSDVAYFAHVSGFVLGLLYTALFVGRGTPRGPALEAPEQPGAVPPLIPDYRTADPDDPYGTYHP